VACGSPFDTAAVGDPRRPATDQHRDDAMPPISPADAATIFRDAVSALSERLAGDYGELVPEASLERTSALKAKLEQGGTASSAERGIRLSDDHVATLDAWIRLADNAVLHDDTREAAQRTAIADQLRAVRALSAPRHDRLLEDARETELGA
jgi:hypothetical protein